MKPNNLKKLANKIESKIEELQEVNEACKSTCLWTEGEKEGMLTFYIELEDDENDQIKN